MSRVHGSTEVRPFPGSENAFSAGLQQFLAEARNLAQFRDYPSIIAVLDFFPANGTGYMVMEYLDGNTLEQYLTSVGRLEIGIAAQILIPVANSLRICHAAGLIHRDISPDNIFLTSDHRIKVLDFGAARFAIGQQSTNLSVILKEGYAPFEQYQRNGRQGPWTDIYALTATLYRLLTGELPTTAPDRIAGTPLPPLADKGVKASRQLQALMDRGMALQPEQRYQTVDGFLADLQAVIQRAPPPPLPENPAARRRKVMVAAGVAVVAVGGAIGFVALTRDGPQPPVVVATSAPRPEPATAPPPTSTRQDDTTPSVTPAPVPSPPAQQPADTVISGRPVLTAPIDLAAAQRPIRTHHRAAPASHARVRVRRVADSADRRPAGRPTSGPVAGLGA